ncbi:MAG: serine/threonine protein kinase [Deltaproteobacteria bacterium]|nr:serine/threonine protein kinase [Deltaproteobacteria bacterium]
MTTSQAPGCVGQVFEDRYRILRLIGEGGMGAVYEAEHVVVGRHVAIKVLHADMARDHQVVARFYNEARAAGSIGSEHIVEVLDFGRHPAPYLVMELLTGRSLAALLEADGPLSPARASTVLLQVLDALGAAHAKEIVHRDLKPENIFVVTKDGRESIKLVDFGISKLKNADPITGGHLTQTGTVLGTPYYMSPEQALGAKDLDHLTDVYSAGVILYECVTGRQPYSAENYNMLLVKIISEAAPPPRSIRPDLPEPLEQIILKAMAQDRPQRFRSAAEFAAALRAFSEGRRTGVLPIAAAASDTAARISAARARILQGGATLAATTGAPPGAATDLAWTEGTGSAAAPPRKGRAVAITAGATLAVAALAVGAWLAFFRGNGSSVSPTVDQPALSPSKGRPSTADSPTAAPSPTADPPPPNAAVPVTADQPAADAVQLRVAATPADAKIYLDDVELPGNPASARFRKDGLMHKLRVAAPGFSEQTRFVEFTADVEEAFALQPPPTTTDAGPATDGNPAAPGSTQPSRPPVRPRDAGSGPTAAAADARGPSTAADTAATADRLPARPESVEGPTVGPRELDLPPASRRDVPRLEESPYGRSP